jgi:hypothetical protein
LLSGVLVTTIAAALVFAWGPMNYRSSGTLVVMPPKRVAAQSVNPLLELDSRLNATASILVQTITSPLLSFRAGLVPGTDTVTAKNATIGSAAGENGSPFITVSAESRDPLRSPAIIGWITDLSRENLAQMQHELKVSRSNTLTLRSVVAPTPSKPVLVPPIGVTTATILLGLVLTALAAYCIDLVEVRRRGRGLASVAPLHGAGQPPPALVPAWPAASLGTREGRKAG